MQSKFSIKKLLLVLLFLGVMLLIFNKAVDESQKAMNAEPPGMEVSK